MKSSPPASSADAASPIPYAAAVPSGARPSVNATLDIRGVACPGPIIEAKRLLDGMHAGEVLRLISNCPGSPDDVNAWVKSTALGLVDKQETAPGTFEFYIRKN